MTCKMKRRLTKIAAWSAWMILIVITGSLWVYFKDIDQGMEIVNLEVSESKRMATTLFFSKLESIGKISVAILGVLWAFVIYTGTRIYIQTAAQIALFGASNIYLLMSFITYSLGYDFLLGRIFYHSTIDLEAPIVLFWSKAQIVYFSMGLFWFVILALLCREEKRIYYAP